MVSKGKSSYGTELQTVHSDVHCVWIERWPKLLTETDSWAVTNGVVEWPGIWKEQDREKEEEGRSSWPHVTCNKAWHCPRAPSPAAPHGTVGFKARPEMLG